MTSYISLQLILTKAMMKNACGNKSVCKIQRKNIENHARTARVPCSLLNAAARTRHGYLCLKKHMLKPMVILTLFKVDLLGSPLPSFPPLSKPVVLLDYQLTIPSEAIEDLTGGVTTELFTSDILDTNKFWTEELLKVNKEFLFSCSTGIFDNWQGTDDDTERRGIKPMHAYSIMQARELKGEKLLLVRSVRSSLSMTLQSLTLL